MKFARTTYDDGEEAEGEEARGGLVGAPGEAVEGDDEEKREGGREGVDGIHGDDAGVQRDFPDVFADVVAAAHGAVNRLDQRGADREADEEDEDVGHPDRARDRLRRGAGVDAPHRDERREQEQRGVRDDRFPSREAAVPERQRHERQPREQVHRDVAHRAISWPHNLARL